MSYITDLIRELQDAKEGSLKLDAKVIVALSIGEPRDRPTSSIDAALALLPEDWFLWRLAEAVTAADYIEKTHDHVGWIAEVQHRKGGRLQQSGFSSGAYHPLALAGVKYPATPALAICIAALKIKLENQTHGR